MYLKKYNLYSSNHICKLFNKCLLERKELIEKQKYLTLQIVFCNRQLSLTFEELPNIFVGKLEL